MPVIQAILSEMDQEAATTKRVLECVPEEKLSWKPHPKSYSLGQLALHIATLPAGVARIIAQDSVEAPTFQQAEAKSKAEIMETFAKSLGDAKQILSGIDDTKVFAAWTLTRNGQTVMSLPRIGVIRSILMNHNYHHRGQLSVYLRLLDVPVPSIYGPSADENPFG